MMPFKLQIANCKLQPMPSLTPLNKNCFMLTLIINHALPSLKQSVISLANMFDILIT